MDVNDLEDDDLIEVTGAVQIADIVAIDTDIDFELADDATLTLTEDVHFDDDETLTFAGDADVIADVEFTSGDATGAAIVELDEVTIEDATFTYGAAASNNVEVNVNATEPYLRNVTIETDVTLATADSLFTDVVFDASNAAIDITGNEDVDFEGVEAINGAVTLENDNTITLYGDLEGASDTALFTVESDGTIAIQRAIDVENVEFDASPGTLDINVNRDNVVFDTVTYTDHTDITVNITDAAYTLTVLNPTNEPTYAGPGSVEGDHTY